MIKIEPLTIEDAKQKLCPYINGYCKADMCMGWVTTVFTEVIKLKSYEVKYAGDTKTVYLEPHKRMGICLRLNIKEAND